VAVITRVARVRVSPASSSKPFVTLDRVASSIPPFTRVTAIVRHHDARHDARHPSPRHPTSHSFAHAFARDHERTMRARRCAARGHVHARRASHVDAMRRVDASRTRANASAHARGRVAGTVRRVARVGKMLTFVDVEADAPVRGRDGAETTTVYARVREESVSRRVRPGAVVTFDWVEQDGSDGRRRGIYLDARDVAVVASAPVSAVENATVEMVEKYGKGGVVETSRRWVGLIDPTVREDGGGGGMSTFGICKRALGGEPCRDKNCVRRHDPSAEEIEMARVSRERARERSRRAIEAERSEEDPHGEANKEAKGVSDRIFANFCVETFGLKRDGRDSSLVADIAGGSGTLSFEFHVNHGVGCVLVEPRCVSLTPRQRAKWSNLRRRGAREDASAEARDAWLRSELWVECADEQKEARLKEHFTRLVAYTEIATDEDIQEVSASAPPTDLATLASAPFDEFLTKIPRTVANAPNAPAPFTHIRSEFWALDSSVGKRLRDMRPDLLVGMHPDQATEGIIDAALELNLPFAVVPCCTFPELFPNRRTSAGELVASYSDFINYLCAKHPSIRRAFLPFKGRNQVLYRTIER